MLLAITTTGQVVLLAVAATFIGFSLGSAMVMPRVRPGFPGDKLPLFLARQHTRPKLGLLPRRNRPGFPTALR